MITKDKRLLGTVAGAMALAAVTGFGVARCTADPAPAPAAEGGEEAASEALPSSLAITPEAIKAAEIGVEPINAGGLGSEIISQATVTAAPSGEAIVTARGRCRHAPLQTARRSGPRGRDYRDRPEPGRRADRGRTGRGRRALDARA